MSRPSLAEERKAEILEALERCVLRDGLAKTTVIGVARELGCQRTLINHYFGDMGSLLRALVAKLAEEQAEHFREIADASASPGVETMMDYLFRHTPSRANDLIRAIRAVGNEDADASLARMYENFASLLGGFLRNEIPSASTGDCRATAFAIVCLAMSRFQLSEIGVSKRRIAGLRRSAETLVESLRGD